MKENIKSYMESTEYREFTFNNAWHIVDTYLLALEGSCIGEGKWAVTTSGGILKSQAKMGNSHPPEAVGALTDGHNL